MEKYSVGSVSKGGKVSTVLQDKEWKYELAFLADVAAHLNFLNLQPQAHDHMITDMYDAVKAFQETALMGDTNASV